MSDRDAGSLTPVGQFVFLIGVAAILLGLYVGFGMTAHSIGIDGDSLKDLQSAHPVSCGSAFSPDWRSVNCEQALSGRKTAAIVLEVAGAVVFLGSLIAFQRPKPSQTRETPAHPEG